MDYSVGVLLFLSHNLIEGFFCWPYLLSIIISSFMIVKAIKHQFHKANKPENNKFVLPPGPKPWPIVGQLPEMLASKSSSSVPKWIHNVMKEMNTEIACIRLGNIYVIPVTCPSIAREFLRKNDAAFASRPISMSTNIISNGYSTTIFAPFGDQWKKMKKIFVNDLFSPRKHQWLQQKRNEEANNLMFYVYNKCKSNSHHGLVNVRVAAQHYCGNVIRKSFFNTRYFGKGGEHGRPGLEEMEHINSVFTLLKYVYAFSVSDYIPCLRGVVDLDGHESMIKKAMMNMSKYHDPIIEERFKQWNEGSKTDAQDLLDVMISLKDANNNKLLTKEEIKSQIIEYMLAVVDNPSNAVEWALAEMINKPELLQKATEELDNVVGKHRLVQESDIPNLNFVKACLRESFRLHPMVPFNVPHVAMKDTMVANYFIPKGSHVLLSRQELGRNPKVWNEPHEFKPERHLNNNNNNNNKNGGSEVVLTEPDLRFISFSTGRRGCPGTLLGTTLTVMLLARLLHGFTWSLPPNVSRIKLAESKGDMLLCEPLIVVAKPRLAAELYP